MASIADFPTVSIVRALLKRALRNEAEPLATIDLSCLDSHSVFRLQATASKSLNEKHVIQQCADLFLQSKIGKHASEEFHFRASSGPFFGCRADRIPHERSHPAWERTRLTDDELGLLTEIQSRAENRFPLIQQFVRTCRPEILAMVIIHADAIEFERFFKSCGGSRRPLARILDGDVDDGVLKRLLQEIANGALPRSSRTEMASNPRRSVDTQATNGQVPSGPRRKKGSTAELVAHAISSKAHELPTARDIENETGIKKGTITKTKPWLRYQALRRSDSSAADIRDEMGLFTKPDVLAVLIADQNADERRDERSSFRRKPRSRR